MFNNFAYRKREIVLFYYSSNPVKTRWLTAKAKITQNVKADSSKFLDTGREIVRLMRREKATEYIEHVKLAYKYKASRKVNGKCAYVVIVDLCSCKQASWYSALVQISGCCDIIGSKIHRKLECSEEMCIACLMDSPIDRETDRRRSDPCVGLLKCRQQKSGFMLWNIRYWGLWPFSSIPFVYVKVNDWSTDPDNTVLGV